MSLALSNSVSVSFVYDIVSTSNHGRKISEIMAFNQIIIYSAQDKGLLDFTQIIKV